MAKLEKYIKKELRKGISKARIKSALFQAGYKKEDINAAFQRFFPKKPMPPAIKYIVIALVIVGAGYVAFPLISDYLDYLEQRPIVTHRAILIHESNYAKMCDAIFEERMLYFVKEGDMLYHANRKNLSVTHMPDFYFYLSLYKQDVSVFEDPYIKEIIKDLESNLLEDIVEEAKNKEIAERIERYKLILKSVINKEITSFDQCADELCDATLRFNKAIVEGNPDYCKKLPLCQALVTKNRNKCDELIKH